MVYGLFTAIGVVALVLIVATLVSVLRHPDISGWGKVLWAVLAICFPFVGSLVYFTVRRGW